MFGDILCNTCHEILPPELAPLLARLVQHLRRVPGSAIIIHEVETISVGERAFLMWQPEDYRAIFAEVPGCSVTESREELPGRVPLLTTTIALTGAPTTALPALERLLMAGFTYQLVQKRDRDLAELRDFLSLSSPDVRTLSGALLQRRMAFVTAQIATADLLLHT